MSRLIHVLNGPNLNMLGTREPALYGHDSLADAEALCRTLLPDGTDLVFRQSNWEGQLVDWIQEAQLDGIGIVINAGALTHTSVAILDALKMFRGPVMEVHITNIHAREAFRHHSYISMRADGLIAGLGIEGYAAAVRRILSLTHKDD